MTPPLSIITASHNDATETVNTLKSVRETSPPDVEVVVVDDCSCTSLVHYVKPDEHTKLVSLSHRIGCGPSRHIAAMQARGDWLFIVDSHVRFKPGWFDEWRALPSRYPEEEFNKTLFCGTCLGLTSKNMDVHNPTSRYHGATLNLYGPDRNNPKAPRQVYEAVWLPREPEPQDGQELAAVMGACYLINREWFLRLSATRFLYPWGCDEQNLSIATWLAGGTVRLAKNIEVGHKFLLPNEKQSFGVPPGSVVFNKLASMASLLPPPVAAKLIPLLLDSTEQRDREVAKRMFKDLYFLVATQKAHFQSIFVREFSWYCEKFHIPVP